LAQGAGGASGSHPPSPLPWRRPRPYLNLIRPFTRPIIFIIAIRTPAVRDIGDWWRERDRVGHSVDNAAPTMAGDAAREHKDKETGTAPACASVSPGDLGVLAGAGVVGGEWCVDAEVGAGGEDMHAGDQRIEVYGVGVEQSRPGERKRGRPSRRTRGVRGECFGRVPSRSCARSPGTDVCGCFSPSRALVVHGREIGTERRRRKRLSPTLALAPNSHTACGTGVGDASSSGPSDGSLSLLPLLNDRTLIVFVHPAASSSSSSPSSCAPHNRIRTRDG
jgi:hypothetical protein